MTGVAALALSAAFTSCSKNEELYDQGAIDQMNVEKVKQTYNEAFIKVFGQPSANQDWGFGSSAKTRSVDVNGNLWESRPEVTEAEATAIFNYVNRVKSEIPHYAEESPVNLKNFFVTQVSGGLSSDDNCLYYPAGRNWGDKVHGASKMNHLQISKSATRVTDGTLPGGESEWQHANNFNASQNRDWDGNTMFVDWGTQNFAYHSTEDSKYHDKWIIIDGQYIGYPGKYYVCFDFIADAPVKTSFQIEVKSPYRDEWFSDNVTIDGEWDATSLRTSGRTYEKTFTYYDQKQQKDITETVTFNYSDESNVRFKGFNVEGGNMNIPANDIYTDWIVRLVEAQPKNGHNYTICVIGEDLTVGGADEEDLGADFDFNDVVFDVALEANETWVRLKAAGGTLPLTIDGIEIHGKFGVDTNVMVNTGAGPNKDYVEFKLNNVFTDAKSIPVFVTKGGRSVELTAVGGEPASKIGVKIDYVWCRERVGIVAQYPMFSQWVQSMHPGTIEWY